MNTYFRNMSILLITLCTLNSFGADDKYSQKFRDKPPFFYAVIAAAAYKHDCAKAQEVLDKHLGAGQATAEECRDFENDAFGHTNLLLVKEKDEKGKTGRLHIGIEGSSEIGNWVGNALMPLRGLVSDYDVPHGIRKKMHRIFKHWEKSRPGSTLVSIVGHSQGGMYASQVVRSHHEHYTKPLKNKSKNIDRSKRQGRTTVVTFNGFKPKSKGNQYHFATAKECAATLFSSNGRYIKIKEGNNYASIASNHSMKYIFEGLQGKNWDTYIG